MCNVQSGLNCVMTVEISFSVCACVHACVNYVCVCTYLACACMHVYIELIHSGEQMRVHVKSAGDITEEISRSS